MHRNMGCRSEKVWRQPPDFIRSAFSTRLSSGTMPLATAAAPSLVGVYLRGHEEYDDENEEPPVC